MEKGIIDSLREQSETAQKVVPNKIRYEGMLKPIALYSVTLGLLYAAFWCGYYFLSSWWGVGIAIIMVSLTSILLGIYKDKSWSAIVSCLSVSAGIGLSISTFYIVVSIEPSRFFGLVLLVVLLYKALQIFLMSHLKRKTLVTSLFIFLEVIGGVVFFIRMNVDAGLNSQIGFAFVTAIFLSFGQLALYKCGANGMWRTIALSYIIGFVFIVVFIVVLIISILAEDGSAFEIFGGLTFGDINGKKKNKGGLSANNIFNETLHR